MISYVGFIVINSFFILKNNKTIQLGVVTDFWTWDNRIRHRVGYVV